MSRIMAAIDEFQRELIVEGMLEAWPLLAHAGAGGRKSKLDATEVGHARMMYESKGDDRRREYTVEQIASAFGVSLPIYLSVKETAA